MPQLNTETIKKAAVWVGSISVIVGGLSGAFVWSVNTFVKPAWAEDIKAAVSETLEKQTEKFNSINRDLTLQSNTLRDNNMAAARREAEIRALKDTIDKQTRLIELLIQKVAPVAGLARPRVSAATPPKIVCATRGIVRTP